jgi:Ca2+-transporting ATPase
VSNWYQLEPREVLACLDSDASQGLSTAEAARRLMETGLNQLIDRGRKNPWRILWEQLTAPLVVILIMAILISIALGNYEEALVILAIVLLNTLLGYGQEYRSERAVAALKALIVPTVKVRRGGRVEELSAIHLVPGDIVLLEAGNVVSADCRLLDIANLSIQEASLTGESEPVAKTHRALGTTELALGDRRNMAYMGTLVTSGRGRAVVTETGMETELGRIASLVQAVDSHLTPLQKRLNQLGRRLVAAALFLVGVVFALGLTRGEDFGLMFLTAVSLAVAAVPEGLPAVVAISLALGAQRLLARGALMRQLPAVETLGSVTAICNGKTGTLTQNRMTVAVLDVAGYRLDLTAYIGRDVFSHNSSQSQANLSSERPALSLLLAGGALCNDAFLTTDETYFWPFVGEPTEGALLLATREMGLSKDELEQIFPRLAEVPFDPDRKCMTTVHRLPDSDGEIPSALRAVWRWIRRATDAPYLAFTKGAVDGLIAISSHIWVGDRTEPIGEVWRLWITSRDRQLAQEGMRVLGIAFRPLHSFHMKGEEDTSARNAIFIGLVGMSDPLRPNVQDAVVTCKAAGIHPVMITGDHPLTALHIANQLSLSSDGSLLTGTELDRMSPQELQERVEQVSVYARVTPQHKLDIVRALQQRGHVVAMIGDGVNDAPALKQADIGISMGRHGTDVAKEAADMVLLDDNFATIVAAVHEGRVIYDNIRKFMKYMLGSNSGEIWVMLFAPFLGMPLPLLPLQILWINLMTDGLPALALGLEPAERHTMRRPPYPPYESIFARGLGWSIIWVGLLMGLVSLGTGYWYWRSDRASWQTMVFSIVTLSQLGNALAIRSDRDSIFAIGWLSNKPLLGAVVLTLGLQIAVIYNPFLQQLFTTTALSATDAIVCLALSSAIFWGVELEKWFVRHRLARKAIE